MHKHDLSHWEHSHAFDQGNPRGEVNTRRVVVLTALMMVVELVAGWLFNSMALLADGWHMATHVAALGMTAVAYTIARRRAGDRRFAFGTWKVEILGGFASAIVLGLVALYMVGESVHRLVHPLDVRYQEALVVAVVGLLVNLLSAYLLHDHGHGHHGHEPHGHSHHGDLNLRAAYLHVLADAATSVLAIIALVGGMLAGWGWLDPIMGIVGAVVISVWAYGLLRDTSRVLLDCEMDHPVVQEVREAVECDGDARVTDLHVWRVGRQQFACIVCVVAERPLTPQEYKARLAVHEEIAHVTLEVVRCPEHDETLNEQAASLLTPRGS